MNLDRLQHSDKDSWVWFRPLPMDVPAMVALSDASDVKDIEQFFEKSPTRLSYHLQSAILEYMHGIHNKFLLIAKQKDTDKIIAWSWVSRGEYTIFSNDEMAMEENCTIDETLPTQSKIKLLAQMIQQWIVWCEVNRIPVLTTNTFREKQDAFLKLHEAFGFTVRGSFAYKRIV